MIESISRLMNGENIADVFTRSRAFWERFYEQHRDDSYETLQPCVNYSLFNEYNAYLGVPNLAKELFVLSAIATVREIENAHNDISDLQFPSLFLKAVKESDLSIEIKPDADIVSAIYDININEG